MARYILRRLGLGILSAVVVIAGMQFLLRTTVESTITRAEFFALGPISVGGEAGEGELALRSILAESSAESRLLDMLPDASPAGRLYVLAGLAKLQSPASRNVQALLWDDMSTVEIRSGCEASTDHVAGVARSIEHWQLERLDSAIN